jgi:hypothetical protein
MSILAGVQALHKKIDLAKLRAEKRVTAYVEERITTIFTDLVTHTPQFSGNLVKHWFIEYGPWTGSGYSPTGAYAQNLSTREAYQKVKQSPYSRGDDPAVAEVLTREFSKLAGLEGAIAGRIRWNSKVYFVNTAPYAGEVDQGIGPTDSETGTQRNIRPENLYYGKVFLMTRAKIKYPELK